MYLADCEERSLFRLIFGVFYRPSHQTPILNMIFGECKKLPDFSVVSKNSLRKWCRKLEFCYKRGQKNNNDASESMRMLRIETCNSITKVAPAQVFSCKYREIFYPS